jgi:three-Cys-motif partner protein
LVAYLRECRSRLRAKRWPGRRVALQVLPPFDHYVFIEKDEGRYGALQEIEAERPNVNMRIIKGEANEELRGLVASPPWRGQDESKSRGVVFLDPYALHVDWSTLQALASTEILDVWYLFPIRDTIRQLARNFKGIGPKEAMLDRVLISMRFVPSPQPSYSLRF